MSGGIIFLELSSFEQATNNRKNEKTKKLKLRITSMNLLTIYTYQNESQNFTSYLLVLFDYYHVYFTITYIIIYYSIHE